jgi:hypothetical protein
VIPWVLEAQAKTYRNDPLLAIETGKRTGTEFISLSPAGRQLWVNALKPMDKQQMTEMDGMGLSALKMYKDIIKLLGKVWDSTGKAAA